MVEWKCWRISWNERKFVCFLYFKCRTMMFMSKKKKCWLDESNDDYVSNIVDHYYYDFYSFIGEFFFRKWQQRMKKEKDARCFHFDRHCSNICVTRNGRITKTIDCWLLFKKMILSFCKRIVSCFSWFDFSLLLFIQSINQNEKKK